MDAIAKAFVSSRRRGRGSPVAQVCGLESLTALAGDEAVDVSSLESAATDCATCVIEANRARPGVLDAPGSITRGGRGRRERRRLRGHTRGRGRRGGQGASGGPAGRVQTTGARPRETRAPGQRARLLLAGREWDGNPPNHSRGPNSRGPVSSNNSLGSRGPEDAKTSSADSDRDAGVESTAALAFARDGHRVYRGCRVARVVRGAHRPRPRPPPRSRRDASKGKSESPREDSSSELAGAYASAALRLARI